MASKESKRPCGAARAGGVGGGQRARPQHARVKGANWRAEQGGGAGREAGRAPRGARAGWGRCTEDSERFRSREWSPERDLQPPLRLWSLQRPGPRAEAITAEKLARQLLPRVLGTRLRVAALVRGLRGPPAYGCRRGRRGSRGLSRRGMREAGLWVWAARGPAFPCGWWSPFPHKSSF